MTTDILCCFLQHGMDGSAADFYHFGLAIEAHFKLIAPSKDAHCFVWRSNVNKGRTADGIMEMATRSAAEFAECWKRDVDKLIDSLDKDRHVRVFVALVGHSMGGLICRYMARLLLEEHSTSSSSGKSAHAAPGILPTALAGPRPILAALTAHHPGRVAVVPLNFTTVSTPHLGVRRPTSTTPDGSPATYTKILGALGKQVSAIRMGLSGRELLLTDDPNEPMIFRLCQQPFQDALARFKYRTAVGSTCNDIVPYASAAVRSVNPFVKDSEYRVRFSAQGLEVSDWSGFDKPELYGKHMEEVLSYCDPACATAASFNELLPKAERAKSSQQAFPLPAMEAEPNGTKHADGEPLPVPEIEGPVSHRRSASSMSDRLRAWVSGSTESKSANGLLAPPAARVPSADRSAEATFDAMTGATDLDFSKPLPDQDKQRLSFALATVQELSSQQQQPDRETGDDESTLVGRPASAPPPSVSDTSTGGEATTGFLAKLTTDSPPSLIFPPALLTAAQRAMGPLRRLSFTLSMTTHPALFFMNTHPMMIGKGGGASRDVVEVGFRAAELLARVIVVDFVEAVAERV